VQCSPQLVFYSSLFSACKHRTAQLPIDESVQTSGGVSVRALARSSTRISRAFTCKVLATSAQIHSQPYNHAAATPRRPGARWPPSGLYYVNVNLSDVSKDYHDQLNRVSPAAPSHRRKSIQEATQRRVTAVSRSVDAINGNCDCETLSPINRQRIRSALSANSPPSPSN